MFADSEKEKDEWIGVIGRAIVQASSTLIKEGRIRIQLDIPFSTFQHTPYHNRYHTLLITHTFAHHLANTSPYISLYRAHLTLYTFFYPAAKDEHNDDSEEEHDVPFNPNA